MNAASTPYVRVRVVLVWLKFASYGLDGLSLWEGSYVLGSGCGLQVKDGLVRME